MYVPPVSSPAAETVNSVPLVPPAIAPLTSRVDPGVAVPIPTLPPVKRAEYVALLKVEVPVKVLAETPVWVYAPSLLMPEMPVKAPVFEISQSEESMETRLRPLPMAIVPVEVPVLIFVAKLDEALRFMTAPLMVAPRLAVKAELAVKVPLAVRPEVAVMRPDMVGVAVQEVPETVKLPPRLVR